MTTATDEPKARKKREPKPVPPPRFAVGELVTTKHTARVPCPGLRGRKWLFLLPGCKWRVVAVTREGRKQPEYLLTSVEMDFPLKRKEHRLRPV